LTPSIFQSNEIVGLFDQQFSHDDAWKIGNAAGRFLPSLVRGFDRGRANTQCICVGHDMRTHSPALAERLIEGIRCAAVNVIHIGMTDTPQLYFAVNHLSSCGGIMVTASHKPARYNGLRISGQSSSRVVSEEIIKYEGTPRRERVGQCYMQKAMRDSHAIFGGALSGHFYYGENACTHSGLITLAHILNTLHQTDRPVSELVRPLYRYCRTGEISFQVEDKQAMMHDLGKLFAEGKIDRLDGITIDFKDWWCNCRPSHAEPFLRLNAEARTQDLLDEKVGVIKKHLGEPV